MMYLLPLLVLVLAAGMAAAEDDDVRPRQLTLRPAAPSSPALKYALLPELRDTVSGNAALHYRQAIANLLQDAPPEMERSQALNQWTAAAHKNLPREEMAAFLKQRETTFLEVDAAARSEHCDWGLTEELRNNGFARALPEIQELRVIGSLLSWRIRNEAAEGRMGKAVRALQAGFAMSRHIAKSPMIIPALVGMAFSGIMLNSLEACIQQPDAPNFYWPLTDLPRPFHDLRKPMQGERVWAYGCYPGAADMAADLHAQPWPADQVEKVATRLREDLNGEPKQNLNANDEAAMMARIAARHEAAKKVLIDEGRPRELVDAMPQLQPALLVALQQYDRLFDETLKVQSLPYWEAQAAFEKAEGRQKAILADPNGPAIPLPSLLLSGGVKHVFAARTRIDRFIAVLRCIEAVRLHAAAHDGNLPASLDDIKDAPVPADPFSGKPFDYRLAGDRAFLHAVSVPGQPVSNFSTPNYELVINRQ